MSRIKLKTFATAVAKNQWESAAEAYAEFQSAGNDYSRIEFFGPAQVQMCGDVSGLRVLDVGCGSGYMCRELSKKGAKVTGVDLSSKMIRAAREHSVDYDIEYEELDAAKIAEHFKAESFDLATACISLQDMPKPELAINAIRHVLRQGSRFVSCNTHPCTDTPYRKWVRDSGGNKRALEIADYFETGPLEFEWEVSGSMHGYKTTGIHAKLSDWINWFIEAGFRIRRIEEPKPTETALSKNPDLNDGLIIPFFILFDLEKPIV